MRQMLFYRWGVICARDRLEYDMYETVSEICDFHGLELQHSDNWRNDGQLKIVEKNWANSPQ